ncbi:MAG: DUF4340 domain-containing protein [Actinobacteria bacterium]|nr:DUF4340 domain-containing protein [Actinomycetota bacterium]
MSNRSVVALLIVALSLAGMVLIFERQISQETEPSTDEYKVFKAYSIDQVESVSLVNGDLAVQLKRRPEGWQLTSPVVAAADEQRVKKLLSQLAELMEVEAPIKAAPGKTINMATYGLAEPSQKIIVSYGGVQEAGLSLGHRTERQDRLYARLGKENRVMIIDAGVSRLLEEIAADTNLYRSRRIFQAKYIDNVLEIQVLTAESQDEKPIALQRSELSGRWVLRAPLEDRADQEKVQELLGKCAALQAAEFIKLPSDQAQLAQTLKVYGLTGEEKTDIIALAAEGMQKILLYLGRPDKQNKFRYGLVEKSAVLARSQEVVKIPADFAKALPRSAESLRDRKFLRFNEQKVTEVYLNSPAGTTVLAQNKTKGQWVLKEDNVAADQEIVGKFLDAIKKLTATGFAGEAAAEMGFNGPFLTIQIKTYQQGKDNNLQIGARTKDGKHRYARLENDKTVRLVRAEAVNDLAVDRLHFYERKLAQVSRRDVKECAKAIGQDEWQAIQKDGQWWISKPEKVRADNDLVGEAIGVLDPLRVKRIVADKLADGDEALAKYGLDEPQYRLTVVKEIKREAPPARRPGALDKPPVKPEAKYKKEDYVLLVGRAVDEQAKQYYGRLKGKDLVFTIAKNAVDKINSDWRSKRVWPLVSWQAKQISKIEITKGSETLTLEKPRENWQVITPKKFWPNQQEVKKLVGALLELEAVEFRKQNDDKQYGLDEPRMVVKAVLEKTPTSEQKEYRFYVGKLIEGKGYAVKTDGEDAIRLVAADELKPLEQNYLRLREKKMLSFQTKEVKAVEISERNKKKYRAQRVETGWTLTLPAGAAANADNLESILKTLSNLRASEIVADTLNEAKKYGLDKPYLTLTVEMKQKETHTLLIGDEIKQAGGKDETQTRPRYAVLGGDSTVFVISGENVEVLVKGIMFEGKTPGT